MNIDLWTIFKSNLWELSRKCHWFLQTCQHMFISIYTYIFSLWLVGFYNPKPRFSEPDRTGRSDHENRFFKPKELDVLLIPWTLKTGVGPHEPVRTVWSNPLAIFFFFLKKQLNTILFYLIKLSISYKE